MECITRVLTKAQRAGILERLKHNYKYAVVVSCGKAFPQKDALEFASVLREAGWTVSGPHVDESCAEGLEIGVRDLRSPCPSAHLLLDVLVSVAMNARLVTAPGPLPSVFLEGCSLLLGAPVRTDKCNALEQAP